MNEVELYQEEGFRAYIKRNGRGNHNPYPAGTPEHDQFQQGWQQAAQQFGQPKKKPGTTPRP
jgi:hypothetical protein